jgi:cellulose biosynthesis protein BcsQ
VRVVAVYSIKGGVGKTATAVNLAYLSAAAGVRTLLWDLDPQGSATFCLRMRDGIDGKLRRLVRGKESLERLARATDHEGLDLLPADFEYRHLDLELERTRKPRRRLRRLLGPLADHYDHVYLDCAPSISLVSEGVFAAADALLVPTIPTTLSLRTLDQLARYLAQDQLEQLEVLPFFCMADLRKALHRRIVAEREARPWEFLRTSIPYSSIVEQMAQRRAPVGQFAPGSDVDRAYRELWRETMLRTRSWLGWADPKAAWNAVSVLARRLETR